MKIRKIMLAVLSFVGFMIHSRILANCNICGCNSQTVNRFYTLPSKQDNACTTIIRKNNTSNNDAQGAILSDPANPKSNFGSTCTLCGHGIDDHNYDTQNGILCSSYAKEKTSNASSCDNLTIQGTITSANCK